MATTTGPRAAASFPAFTGIGAGNLCVAYGHHAFTAEQAAADVFEACKVPRGAVVLGGWLRAEDMDSNASETIDMDVGYAANGDVAADPDAFGNFGVLTGDAIAEHLPEGGQLIPLHGTLKDGPVTLTADTVITVTFVDDAATFAAGTVTVVVFYVTP
jgi:hypothetical protein